MFILEMIKLSGNKFKIRWVKVHVSIQENENADYLAKQAAENNIKQIPYDLESPISNLKRTIKELIPNSGNSNGIMVTRAGLHTNTSKKKVQIN